jgi:hypothetical protein
MKKISLLRALRAFAVTNLKPFRSCEEIKPRRREDREELPSRFDDVRSVAGRISYG